MVCMAEGFGKVILFNEHFVVHKIPSIACAIGDSTTATVEDIDIPGFQLIDDRPATPAYKKEKAEAQFDSINFVLKAAGVNPLETPIKITLAGNLLAASGVGASGASCAALARALNEHFDLGFDDKKINELAYEGEKGYHGTPSGIDNTAATYGGLLYFIKGKEPERLQMKEPVEIVMGNTGLIGDTKALVAGVAERKEKDSEKYDKIFEDAKNLVEEAKVALTNNELEKVGELMNKNHELLQQIEVSHPKLEELVQIARDNGALGAKMTGGGGGGYMVALTPGETQEKVASAMEAAGFQVLRTKIGV